MKYQKPSQKEKEGPLYRKKWEDYGCGGTGRFQRCVG
jgi:hypothetical protein